MSQSRIIERFDEMLRTGAEPHEKVGWGSQETQQKRFKVLTEVGIASTSSILDVGCGLGDLALYLKAQGFKGQYRGVDVSPNMIAGARARQSDMTFDVLDIVSLVEPLPEYDFVLMSGAANLACDDYQSMLEALIRRMFAMARLGVAFNLLSNRADFVSPGEVYGDPARIVDFCLGVTRSVVMRHNYMPHDFTIYLFPG